MNRIKMKLFNDMIWWIQWNVLEISILNTQTHPQAQAYIRQFIVSSFCYALIFFLLELLFERFDNGKTSDTAEMRATELPHFQLRTHVICSAKWCVCICVFNWKESIKLLNQYLDFIEPLSLFLSLCMYRVFLSLWLPRIDYKYTSSDFHGSWPSMWRGVWCRIDSFLMLWIACISLAYAMNLSK